MVFVESGTRGAKAIIVDKFVTIFKVKNFFKYPLAHVRTNVI